MEREREQLLTIITQWNQNRLDLFALSQPNEDNEFHGVMRFYFQDAGQKVATKCVRVSSTATATDVIKTLIEKFRPDIRMLSIPDYALYEIHENEGERKLADDEKPLLVQLNWHRDDREGRFLLRRMDEETHLPNFDPEHSNFKRKLSKREKKEKKKAEKEKKSLAKESAVAAEKSNKSGEKLAEKLYNEVPETSFTRSISNPEAVMKRKRQQKLEKKLQQLCKEGGAEAGGTLRIFGETLNKDVPYKTLLLSTRDTAASVVQEILEKYGRDKGEAQLYCLVQVVVPHGLSDTNAPSDPSSNAGIREVILDDDDFPLAIEKQHLRSRGTLSFHIKRRPPDYQPRKKKKKPPHIKPEFEVNSDEIRERLQSLNPTNPPAESRATATAASSSSSSSAVTAAVAAASAAPTDLVSDAVQAHSKFNSAGNNHNGNIESSERSASTNSGYGPTDDSVVQPNTPSNLSVPDGVTLHPTTSAVNNSVNTSLQPGQDRLSISETSNHSFPHELSTPHIMPASAGASMTARKGPEVVVYMLQKGNGGMGLSIIATKGFTQEKPGIYIKTVVKGGAADLDGRLEAGDQLLSVDGNSLIGVSQERAAELISKSGPVVTLEVAKSAANYNGLASILSQPSPLVPRNRIPHSQSYQGPLLPQQSQQVLTPTGQAMTPILPQHYPNAMPYQSAMNAATMSASVHNQTLSPVPPSPGGSYLQPGLHSTTQSLLPNSMTGGVSSLQEERHYQNIGMYRQQVPNANGISAPSLAINGSAGSMRPFNGNNALAAVYPSASATLHNSYSSMHTLPQPTAQMPQLNSQTLPSGRPLSTVYPPHMMSRVPSIAQYPPYASQGPIYNRTGQLAASVPTLHHPNQHLTGQQWRNPYDSTNSLMYPMQSGVQGLYGPRNPQMASASRVSVMKAPEEPIPAVSYRYGPSGYPAKQMDSLNNNTSNNANNPAMNGVSAGTQWSKRNSASSSNNINSIGSSSNNNTRNNNSSLDINAQLEEQEERLRQLKLEEQKRQQELEMASMVEEKLLNEAKSRRQDDQSKIVKAYLTGSSDQLFSSTYLAQNNDQGDMEQLHPHMVPKSPTLHFDSGLTSNFSSSRTVPGSNARYHPSGINANAVNSDPIGSIHSNSNNNHHSQDILHLEANSNYHLEQPLQHTSQHQRYPSALKNGDVHSIVNHNNHKNTSGPGAPPKKVSWNDSPLQHAINTPISDTVRDTQSNMNSHEQDVANVSEITNEMATGSTSDFTLQDIDEVLCSSGEQEGTTLHMNTPNVIGAQEVYRDPRERMMLEKLRNQIPKPVQGPEKLNFQEKLKMFAMESGGTVASKVSKSNPSQVSSTKTETSDNNRTDSP